LTHDFLELPPQKTILYKKSLRVSREHELVERQAPESREAVRCHNLDDVLPA